MEKSINWSMLHKRIGNQMLHKTRTTKVQVLIDGTLQDCALIFTEHGSHFYLKPVSLHSRFTDGMQVIVDGNDADDHICCPYCHASIGTHDNLECCRRPAHCESCGTKLLY